MAILAAMILPKPLRIRGLILDPPVVLAPLAGYSDLPFRLICRSCGAPFATTEVMLDRFLLYEGKLRRHLLRMDPADHPLGGQIMGNDPQTMARAAAVLRDLDFEAIDLNFACPVRKVVNRKRGGHLMADPGRALEIIQTVRESVPDRPLLLKLRKSFAAEEKATEAFWIIARGARESGVDAVCVHARSVDQKYSGQADWAFLREVKRAFPDWTVIGSGDVRIADDALRMIEETGVDGVAAARGAIGNPWFFAQVRDLLSGRSPGVPAPAEQRELIERHYSLTVGQYGERKGLLLMRHFGIGYARLHPHPKRARMAFVGIASSADWKRVMDDLYS